MDRRGGRSRDRIPAAGVLRPGDGSRSRGLHGVEASPPASRRQVAKRSVKTPRRDAWPATEAEARPKLRPAPKPSAVVPKPRPARARKPRSGRRLRQARAAVEARIRGASRPN